MNLRWLVGNFSDPEFKLTRQEQREVTRLAHHKYLSKLKLGLWTGGMVIVSWLMLGLAWDPAGALLSSAGVPYARLIGLVILCIVPCIVSAWLYRFIYIGPVRRAMRELGHDICVGCGYRLQGLNSSVERCPECGTPREPRAMPPKEPEAP